MSEFSPITFAIFLKSFIEFVTILPVLRFLAKRPVVCVGSQRGL